MDFIRAKTVGTGGDVRYAPLDQGRTEAVARAHPSRGWNFGEISPWLSDAVRVTLSRTAMRMLRWLRGEGVPALLSPRQSQVATYGRDGQTRPMVEAQFTLHDDGQHAVIKDSPWSRHAGSLTVSKRGAVVYGVLKHMRATPGNQSKFLASMRENRAAGRLNEDDLQAAREALQDWMQADDGV
ncbi:hypothetical protein Mmc1_1667 [Magnetococcus marinus MC-1]|uniref:Uncharacterized protein n=1 Tax=Magnetococcus marinus (strain ATCC BAA-1437 / JCM 17883 / MC-1) TaxID=156889 RepID=A0L883_MAGMM|nr:hypothetical protein [Magnetococcus marinus]ABK44176.1 hypothetical protein Mmc1_1667 [Magnetococcus marinus MC-1]